MDTHQDKHNPTHVTEDELGCVHVWFSPNFQLTLAEYQEYIEDGTHAAHVEQAVAER